MKGASDQERCLRTGRNVTPAFKKGKKEDPGNHQLVILTQIPGKKEHLIVEAISVHREDKKLESGGFTRGKSCLTSLIGFYDEITPCLEG